MGADRKDQFAIEAVIGMVKSTNHRFRVVTVFKRHNADVSDRRDNPKRNYAK